MSSEDEGVERIEKGLKIVGVGLDFLSTRSCEDGFILLVAVDLDTRSVESEPILLLFIILLLILVLLGEEVERGTFARKFEGVPSGWKLKGYFQKFGACQWKVEEYV